LKKTRVSPAEKAREDGQNPKIEHVCFRELRGEKKRGRWGEGSGGKRGGRGRGREGVGRVRRGLVSLYSDQI